MFGKANLYEGDSFGYLWEPFGIKSHNQLDFIIDYQTYRSMV